MVSFFERGGRYLRIETRDADGGLYELHLIDAGGKEQVEWFQTADALDARVQQLHYKLGIEGWFGPYGMRS